MKKVLIISYYWPPAGGGGVMRWLKMSTYISQDSDWKPIIYTPKNAGYLIWDHSLATEVPKEIEVISYPIIEPNNFLDILGLKNVKKEVASGGVSTSQRKQSLKQRILLWVRSNLFVPDPRFLWVNPSFRFLSKIIKSRNIEVIITTGPPHSMHLIGLKLKKKLNVKWIADFRDPWTFIDFFEDLNLSKYALKKHQKLEKQVITNADKLVTVSPSWAKEFEKLYGRKFEVIYNGYDPADFPEKKIKELDKAFSITHIGSLNKDRNPLLFWEVVADICKEAPNFKENLRIRLIGTVSSDVNFHLNKLGLSSLVTIEKHLPHKEVIDIIGKSQLLLLLINNTSNIKGIIPGKFFEYLGANRPIICIGDPESDTAQLIEETKAGKVVGFDAFSNMKEVLLDCFSEYLEKGKVISTTKQIQKFSRRSLAQEYVQVIEEIS